MFIADGAGEEFETRIEARSPAAMTGAGRLVDVMIDASCVMVQ
jgi:hypothetical protein